MPGFCDRVRGVGLRLPGRNMECGNLAAHWEAVACCTYLGALAHAECKHSRAAVESDRHCACFVTCAKN